MSTESRLLAGGALLALLTLTIVVLVVDGPLPGEVGLIQGLQRLGPPAPVVADVVGATTGTEGNLVVGVAAAIWLLVGHGRKALAPIVICLVAMLVIQPVSKDIVDRDRPTETEVEIRTEFTSPSYPSGHSLSTATVWGAALAYVWSQGRRRWAVLFAVPIVCTALASGIHGAHWASDSIAGTIMGAAAAGLAVRSLRLGDRPM